MDLTDDNFLEALSGTDPESKSQEIISRLRRLKDTDGEQRRTRANQALFLYHATGRHSFDGQSDVFDEINDPDLVGYNLIQALVDTKTNHIVRNRVRPMFVTERGDSELKEKALGMQRAVESTFHTSELWGWLGRRVCMLGNLFEGGGVKFWADYENHRVGCDLVFAHEFLVDPIESMRGTVSEAGHCTTYPRHELLARFADDEQAHRAIHEAPTAPESTRGVEEDSVADMVEVWEYWRLPSGYVDKSKPEAWGRDSDGNEVDPEHDGRHCIVIEGAVLLDEAWPLDHFNVAWFRPSRTPTGYWSESVPERHVGAQLELNQWQRREHELMRIHAVTRMFVNRRAKLNKGKLTNDPSDVYEVNGSPSQAVQTVTPQAVPAEVFRRKEEIIRHAEKREGLSEMSIAAMKPKGIDHAPGMQHLADTESIRHTMEFREWEDFHVQAAKIVVDCYRLLAEHDEDFSVVFADSKQLQRIRWRDVDLDESMYHLRVWPTNLLPQTPGARKSYVLDMVNAGLFSKQQATQALDFPDVESVMGDQTAELQNIERMIQEAKSGKNVRPEPFHNIAMGKTQTVVAINRAQADGEDQKTVDNLRKLFMGFEALEHRLAKEQAQMQAEAMGKGPGERAAPEQIPGGPPPQGAPPPAPPGPPQVPPGAVN